MVDGRQDVRLRRMPLLHGLAALRKRVCREHDHRRGEDRRPARDRQQPPVAPGRDRPFALECGTRIELAPPCKHWLREDVVEDLVPATVVASIGDGSQDPLRCESLENRL